MPLRSSTKEVVDGPKGASTRCGRFRHSWANVDAEYRPGGVATGNNHNASIRGAWTKEIHIDNKAFVFSWTRSGVISLFIALLVGY
jgi:hypothetical protein